MINRESHSIARRKKKQREKDATSKKIKKSNNYLGNKQICNQRNRNNPFKQLRSVLSSPLATQITIILLLNKYSKILLWDG
jgi:hypothetical protein